jgi:hypothetical protein
VTKQDKVHMESVDKLCSIFVDWWLIRWGVNWLQTFMTRKTEKGVTVGLNFVLICIHCQLAKRQVHGVEIEEFLKAKGPRIRCSVPAFLRRNQGIA